MGIGSSFSIQKMNSDEPAKVIELWKRVWGANLSDGRIPEAKDGRLLCGQQVDSGNGFYEMHCISTDAKWTFYLLGNQADAPRVYPVIEYVLEHERQFP